MSWMKPLTIDNTALGPLSTWSFSGLKTYEQCPFRRYMEKAQGFRGKSGPAATRGSELHDNIEKYIRGEVEECMVTKEIPLQIINEAKENWATGSVHVEENWYIDMEWNTVTRDKAWGLFIIDYYRQESPDYAIITDWKSGKAFGNELKHAEQLLFYAAGAFARFPDLEYVDVNACYLDQNKKGLEKGYTRETVETLRPQIHKRALLMTTAKNFPPAPSKYNCKWCHLKDTTGEDGRPLCEWGEK